MRQQAIRFASITFALLLLGPAVWAQLPDKVGDTPVPSLAPVIKKVSPAVVNIATRGTVKEEGQRNPFLEDPFFRRFFDAPDQQGPREHEFQSAGSGVIVDAKNGYIVTNAHVVENANEITVTLLNNHTLKAEVKGRDTGSDIAVLKVKPEGLTDIPLADSSHAEVGDYVIAIGNPFGLAHTVTSGIISGLGRSGINPEGFEDFIQTDASINPGNSGGALVNLQGQLVGINTAILSGSGGNIGIGFAIPSNMVKAVLEQILKFGEVRRGTLGVRIQTLVPDVAKSLGLEDSQGSLVSEVVPGSAADKAGVKAGDVITAINGKQVKTSVELRNSIGLMRIGEKVEIGLIRDGKPRRLTATIGEGTSGGAEAPAKIHKSLEGADLVNTDDGSGVLIRNVAPGSPAAQNSLRANDIVVAVGRTRVANLEQLTKALTGSDAYALTVRRGSAILVFQIR
jgi:Do/DeqQ family serine protease